ncbi:MAG TPA: hypothetical protein VGG85_00935 [Terracidiphilus sp.]|jgi:flagellar export protein FliJ
MAVPTALEKLLRIRNLEEEQRQQALGSALAELHRLQSALDSAAARERQGRELVTESARSGQGADRQSGLIQTLWARKQADALGPRIAAAEVETMRLRQEVLNKRVECRQAETLIEETELRATLDTGRRDQRFLDDWFGSSKFRGGTQFHAEKARVECGNPGGADGPDENLNENPPRD